MEIKLEETVTLDFVTNDPYTGSPAAADDGPYIVVYQEGSDSELCTYTADARAGTGFNGLYKVNVACTTGNGFALDKEHSIVAHCNVNGVFATGVLAILVPRAAYTNSVVLSWDDINSITSNVATATVNAAPITWDEINNISSNVNTVLSTGHGAGSWLSSSGGGAIEWSYYLESSVTADPIADVDVWVTTDVTGDNIIARGQTNSLGFVTFFLDAGDYYIWSQKSGWSFDNPDLETVS